MEEIKKEEDFLIPTWLLEEEKNNSSKELQESLRQIQALFSLPDRLILEKIVKEFWEISAIYPASHKGHHSEQEGLFSHSVSVAFESLEKVQNASEIERVYIFLAGLFHDIGKIFRYRITQESGYFFKRGVSKVINFPFSFEIILDWKGEGYVEYENLLGLVTMARLLERAGFFESELYDEEKLVKLCKDVFYDFKVQDKIQKQTQEKENTEIHVVKQSDIENARVGLEQSFEKEENLSVLLDASITEILTIKRINYDYFVTEKGFYLTENTLNFLLKTIQKKSRKYVSYKTISKKLKEEKKLFPIKRYIVDIKQKSLEMSLYYLDISPSLYFEEKALRNIAVLISPKESTFIEENNEAKVQKDLNMEDFDESIIDIIYSMNEEDRSVFERFIHEINERLETGELIVNFHVYIASYKGKKQMILTQRAREILLTLDFLIEKSLCFSSEIKIITGKKHKKVFDGYVLPAELIQKKYWEKFREVERIF